MENKTSFKKHLERILGVNSVPAYVAEAIAYSGEKEVPLIAHLREITRPGRIEERLNFPFNEDFILGPLPNSTTLYAPRDLIQIAKEFYKVEGFNPSRHDIAVPSYEEILTFGDTKRGGFVQFDLGEGFRKDERYELWVTTDFFDLTKKKS